MLAKTLQKRDKMAWIRISNAAAILPFILITSIITNLNMMRYATTTTAPPVANDKPQTNENELKATFSAGGDAEVSGGEADCLVARSDTVPPSLYKNLPRPFVNLGFPKMGTSSIHSFFKCGRIPSSHYWCYEKSVTERYRCAPCMKKAVENGKSPLADCHGANQDVYAQIDDGVYFPQTEILEQIVNDHSNATFFLTFRNMERWYKSLQNWPVRKNGRGGFNMVERIQRSTITGGPSKTDPETFDEWYCKHVQRVRDLIAKNPSHTLVEIDIEDLNTAQRMEDIFGIRQSCWGHKNANALIHPELINATGIEFHWTTINH